MILWVSLSSTFLLFALCWSYRWTFSSLKTIVVRKWRITKIKSTRERNSWFLEFIHKANQNFLIPLCWALFNVCVYFGQSSRLLQNVFIHLKHCLLKKVLTMSYNSFASFLRKQKKACVLSVGVDINIQHYHEIDFFFSLYLESHRKPAPVR